jgi:hypothetical protein
MVLYNDSSNVASLPIWQVEVNTDRQSVFSRRVHICLPSRLLK